MKGRQNLIIALVAAFVVAIIGWTQFVTPEKSKVTEAESKVSTAHQQLQAAQASLSQARQAQAKYAAAYASIVKLGKAVPAQYEVPALIYEIEKDTNLQHVTVTSISPGSGPAAGPGQSSGQASAFAAMPVSLTFTGTYANLYHLLVGLQGLNSYSSTNGVTVNGRLLTIQSVNIAPGAAAPASGAEVRSSSKSNASKEQMTGTISATAYVLPPGQGLTAGASASGPAGTGSSAGGGSGSGAAATPATIKALP